MGRADSPLRDRMVFLVGAQRSGTNWLQRMLATHPGVVSLPSETQLFTAGIDTLARQVQHGALGSTSTGTVFMEREEFLDAAREFCDRVYDGVASRLDPDAQRVLERSPNHVEHLALIGDVYPDAWVVHIVRDGRDVARSLVSQPWGPATVREAAARWAHSVGSARTAAARLARYREVRYEDLLADPAAGIEGVLDFLGLDATPATVGAALQEAGVAYNTDARRPDVAEGKWRTEWTVDDLADFTAVAGDHLAALGYPPAPPLGRKRRRLVSSPRRRSRHGGPARPAAPPERPRLPMELRQRRVDALCAALAGGDVDRALLDLSPSAQVRVVAAGSDRQARGAAGHDLLADAMAADPAPWGTQQRGDVHVAGSMFTVVLGHDGPTGPVERVVVVSFDADSTITGVTLYRFGAGATGQSTG